VGVDVLLGVALFVINIESFPDGETERLVDKVKVAITLLLDVPVLAFTTVTTLSRSNPAAIRPASCLPMWVINSEVKIKFIIYAI
jgi:hypothetical protein